MVTHYLRLALRHARKYTGYLLINIIGLAIGMACFLLIFFHIWDELSYDRFHDHSDRIYRLVVEQSWDGRQVASAPVPLGPVVVEEIPEVQKFVRFKSPTYKWMLQHEDKAFNERRFLVTDPEIFDVFSWTLARGNPREALTVPNGIVLTEAMAKKYFGGEDPMGKIIRAENSYDFQVTGILNAPPANTHFQFDFLTSFRMESEFHPYGPGLLTNWDWPAVYTYLLLVPNADPRMVEQKITDVLAKYRKDASNGSMRPFLQPLTDIHLYSNLEGELEPNSDIGYVYLFTAIACLVLFIGCINFMNLATARAATRATEVGMRKVVGASRMQLATQFLGESVLVAVLALPLSIILMVLLLPTFNELVGKDLEFGMQQAWWFWPGIFAGTLLIGIASGSYPAFFLSAFQPIGVLKGTKGSNASGTSGHVLRRILVVVQFTISIVLIVGTIMIDGQMDYVRQKRMGFDKNHVLYTRITFETQYENNRWVNLKQRLSENPNILSTSFASSTPGGLGTGQKDFRRVGDKNVSIDTRLLSVDAGYLETMGIDLLAGRFFLPVDSQDTTWAVVLNETAVKRFGWTTMEDAIDHTLEATWDIQGGGRKAFKYQITGVVQDFHMTSLHQPIEPILLFPSQLAMCIMLKVNANNIPEALTSYRETWTDIYPDFAFEYTFLDDQLNQFYHTDEKLGQLIGSFSILAIVIACLGLFGLASFTAEQRTKEIGIRKVLGASIPTIMGILSKEIIKLILIANIIAWPMAYLFMDYWLQNFAYRIELSVWLFLAASLLVLIIALLTVAYHAIKAATTNPVETLRYE